MPPSRHLLAAVAALATPLACAQAPQSLEPVVVTATRSERSALDVPASVDVLEREEVRDAQWRVNLSEVLGRVPGVVALNRQNYAQDLQISIRGFGARSTFGVRGIRLYLDGVPATMPDGQGQVSHFPLNAVERIEVLRGPFSALYGNSSGGVIAMTTRVAAGAPMAELASAAGAYGTWRAGGSAATGGEGLVLAADVARFSTEGFREHSSASRDTLNLRAAADTSIGTLRLSANGVDMPQAYDPLGLTRAQADADPRQAVPQALQFNTRKSVRQGQLGGELETNWRDRWRSTISAWTGARDVVQFLAIPVAAQANPAHSGGVVDLARRYEGVDARVQRAFARATFTLGIDIEQMNETRRGYENFGDGRLGVVGRLRRDERNEVLARDAYAQLESELATNWQLTAGVRASRVRFLSDDHYLANGDDSGELEASAVNPVVGVLRRLGSHASAYAAYGRGFETPTLNELAYRPDGAAGLNSALEPARSDNVELGLKWNAAHAAATLALFGIRTRDEIVVVANSGGRASYANAASTRRYGIETTARWQPSSDMSAEFALATNRAKFVEPFAHCSASPCTGPELTVPAGTPLSGVPALSGFIRLAYRIGGLDMAAEWRAQSSVPVEDSASERAPGYGWVNATLARSLSVGRAETRAFLRIDNVLDARTIGSVIVNEGNGRYYEPAPGRSWTLGLDARM